MRFGRRKSGEYSGTSGFIDTPKKGYYRVKVRLLDDTELSHDFPKKTKGQAIMDHVYWTLDLDEKDYFGLAFQNEHEEKQWLDPVKTLRKQLHRPYYLEFCVKFYVAEPAKLREELTRYLFFLQGKRDLLVGKLVAPPHMAAEIFSLVLQSELGDYDQSVHDRGYVSEFRFLPTQSLELEEEIGEIHRTTLIGQAPATAELSFLHKIKWLDMYGMELHHVMGMDKTSLQLGLTPVGITLLQNKTKVGSFVWGRITNISFKRKKLTIRVEGREPGQPDATFNFLLKSSGSCKQLWRSAIEQHSFFRLTEASKAKPKRLSFLRRGSKYRFSGRTQWQAEKEANEQRQEPKFKRTPSRRYARRSFCGQSGVRRDQNDDIMFMRASSLLTRTADGTRSSTSRGSQPSPRTASRSQVNPAVRGARPDQIQSNGLLRTKAVAALDRQGSDGRSPHPDIVAQSRSSPHEERELDIQRLGQRPVDHSASYHFDHPSSRRQYGSLLSVESGSSDQHGFLPTRTMSNQSVLRGGHMPAIPRHQLPPHVSTENIPTDDEPPPAYTPYPSTVLPSVSSGPRQIPSYLANCPPPPSIPAPSPPVRPSASHSVEQARNPITPNNTGSGQEVSNMVQQQRVESVGDSEVRGNEDHQAEASQPVVPQMVPAITRQEQRDRQQRQSEAVHPGLGEETETSGQAGQESDGREWQEEHHEQREVECIQMTSNDEVSRPPEPTDTVIIIEHGSLPSQPKATRGDLSKEEDKDWGPPVSVQGERQMEENLVQAGRRELEEPIISTPVREERQQPCSQDQDQRLDNGDETDGLEPSREQSAMPDELPTLSEVREDRVPLGSPSPFAEDEYTHLVMPVVRLDCFPSPPIPLFAYDDDLPPPPSPVRLSRSTEYLLLHTDADSESSTPLVLTPYASPVPLRKSLLLHCPGQVEGIFSRPSSLLSLPPLPDNYGQDGCDTWLELQLPPPPDHLSSRSTSPQSDQDIVEVEDVQQPLLLANETWESNAKNNPVVDESPARPDLKAPLSSAGQEEFEKADTPVEVSRLVARVRNSLSRDGQDGIRSALLSETDDGKGMQNPCPDTDGQLPAAVHRLMSPVSDRGDYRVDGTCRSGYGSDQQDYRSQYQVSTNCSRSSLPGHRYSSAIQACLDRDYAMRQGYMSDENLKDAYSSLDDSPASTVSREFRYGKKERERLMEQADLFASRLRNWNASPQVRPTPRPLYATSSNGAVHGHRRYVMTPPSSGPGKPVNFAVARSSSCDILEFGSPRHRGYGHTRPVAQALSTRPGLQHTVL